MTSMTRCFTRLCVSPRGIPPDTGRGLLAVCTPVCYKQRYMRKWMSERLKRRKKPGSGAAKETVNAPAPEPLQPRFYDDEPAAPAA
jgi:hypothetical protein